MANKNSVIYSYSCGKIDCNEEYMGESGRTFSERFKEHLRLHPQYLCIKVAVAMKHLWRTLKIIGREENSLGRTIKEAMYIRVNNPTLNRKYWEIQSPTYLGQDFIYNSQNWKWIINRIKMHNNTSARFCPPMTWLQPQTLNNCALVWIRWIRVLYQLRTEYERIIMK